MGHISPGILFILGLAVLGGTVGAKVFQKLRVPQVVGYVVIGLALGESGIGAIRHEDVVTLRPFNLFALGIIGFLVGGELKTGLFRKYGKQFFGILLGEGLGAFVAVGAPVVLVMYLVTHDLAVAAACGIIFGAISSATDPASTIDVLWECRAKGVLTTSATAIVALDDALAMTLYGLGTSIAGALTHQSGSLLGAVGGIANDLGGAAGAGFAFAIILCLLLRWLREPQRSLALAVGSILLLISIAQVAGMDIILATMTLGCALTNLAPRRSESLFKIMRGFSVPIYVLFFVLVGARLSLSAMPWWLWTIVAIYVIGRSLGKIGGAWFGATVTNSAPAVRRFLGLGLMAQGGVAVGLSIMASQHLGNIQVAENLSLGEAIIFGVTATTLIVQLGGPPLVKLAVKLAGEIGRDVTEADVIDSWTVADVMDGHVRPIPEDADLGKAIEVLSSNSHLLCPVVNGEGELVGTLSLAGIRSILIDRESWKWLVASDAMQALDKVARPNAPLRDILEHMRDLGIQQMPVVDGDDGLRPVGMIDFARIQKQISREVLRRQRAEHET